jgi:hypothetical protein
MQMFIDKADGRFIDSPLFKSPVDSVSFKRGDAASVRVSFVNGFTVEPLADGAEIIFGIKSLNKFDSEFLVSADTYEESGDSYVLAPSFNTSELADALNSGDDDGTNDVASLAAMLEISWSEDGGTTWQSSATITANIANDVVKGVEGTPTSLPSPEDWLAAHGITYDPTIVQLTGESEYVNTLEGIPTVGVPAGRCQIVVNGMRVSFYVLNAGETPSNEPSVVLPLDADEENQKYWRLSTTFSNEASFPDFYSDNLATITPGLLTNSRQMVLPDADGTVCVLDSYEDDTAAAAELAIGDLYYCTSTQRFRARTT